MEENLKKLRVVKFIPTIVVQTKTKGQYIATSICLYNDLHVASEVMEILKKNIEVSYGLSVVRSSIIRKVFVL